MKKLSFALGCLLLAGVVSVADEQRPIDLVVVLDTSSSMHASYREVSEYAVGPMLKEFLRVGDTFHLIGFSGAPRTEISRRIEGIGDVETIIGRMLLMYPLDPYSDFIAALEYVSRYLSDLPETRQKTIVLISDGEHSPPPSSAYAGLDAETVKARLAETTTKLKGNGWSFHFLRVPFTGRGTLAPLPGISSTRPTPSPAEPEKSLKPAEQADSKNVDDREKQVAPASAGTVPDPTAADAEPSEEKVDVSDAVAALLAAPVVDWTPEDSETLIGDAIAVVFPKDIGKSDRSIVFSISVRNPSPKPVYLETEAILINGVDRMAKRSFRELGPRAEGTLKIMADLPPDFPVGRTELLVEPIFTGSIRISPQSGTIAVDIAEAPFARFFSATLPALLFVLGLIAALLLASLVILLSRRLTAAPNRVAAGAVRPARDKDRRVAVPVPGTETRLRATQSSGGAPEAKAIESRGVPTSSRAAETSTGDIEITRKAGTDDAAILAGFASRAAADEEARKRLLAERAPARPDSIAPLRHPLPTADEKPILHVSSTFARKSKTPMGEPPYEVKVADARIMLSLFVEDQNTFIGKRNIHLLKAGTTLDIGGGNSDFLIFLVPLPRRIAEVRFDGERCIFVPRRPEFFPDIGREPVEDCVGKTIRVISQKGYELKVRLDRFEDPLASLNRFLHSIETPGR